MIIWAKLSTATPETWQAFDDEADIWANVVRTQRENGWLAVVKVPNEDTESIEDYRTWGSAERDDLDEAKAYAVRLMEAARQVVSL